MRIKPLPPAAYTATVVIVYASCAVGVVLDVGAHAMGLGALGVIIAATMAIVQAVKGDAAGESVAACATILTLCADFAVAPPVSPAWALWAAASFAMAVLIMAVRVRWLCKQL